MSDDPKPWLRCRCVHRRVEVGHDKHTADPYYDRCRNLVTQEDGKCDHCRPDVPCEVCGPTWLCCLHPTQYRFFVALAEPCLDVRTQPAGVAF